MTKPEIAELVARIASLWPSWRVPQTDRDAAVLAAEWRAILGDLDARAVVAALRSYAAEGHEFAPPVGLLRRLVTDASHGTPPDLAAAYGEVRQAFASHGYYRTPDWSSAAIAEVVRALGGWQHMCQSWTIESEPADRAHFRRLYEVCAQRHRADSAPPADRAVLDGLLVSIGHPGALDGEPIALDRPPPDRDPFAIEYMPSDPFEREPN